jgi:hypothetical protein
MGECAALNLSNPSSVDRAAANFRKAVISISNDPGRWHLLVWDREPSSIQRFKPQPVENSRKLAEGQAAALKAHDARVAHEKAQKSAEQRCRMAIDAFCPIGKRGTIEHRLKDDTHRSLTQYLENQKSRGCNMEEVEQKIRKHIDDIYNKLEVEASRL